jgi:hypothetical protein
MKLSILRLAGAACVALAAGCAASTSDEPAATANDAILLDPCLTQIPDATITGSGAAFSQGVGYASTACGGFLVDVVSDSSSLRVDGGRNMSVDWLTSPALCTSNHARIRMWGHVPASSDCDPYEVLGHRCPKPRPEHWVVIADVTDNYAMADAYHCIPQGPSLVRSIANYDDVRVAVSTWEVASDGVTRTPHVVVMSAEPQ